MCVSACGDTHCYELCANGVKWNLRRHGYGNRRDISDEIVAEFSCRSGE